MRVYFWDGNRRETANMKIPADFPDIQRWRGAAAAEDHLRNSRGNWEYNVAQLRFQEDFRLPQLQILGEQGLFWVPTRWCAMVASCNATRNVN